MPAAYGLEWHSGLWDLEPRWTVEPDLVDVQNVAKLALSTPHNVKATYITQGAFNKIYRVDYGGNSQIMRVTLPVDPRSKTESEVATMQFVKQHGVLPVPNYITHNSSASNQMGFEWILMELMPGVPLGDRWKTTPWSAKVAMTRQLCAHAAAMFSKRFKKIGNLYSRASAPHDDGLEIGRMVSLEFFWGDRVTQCFDRGPFRSSHEWIATRLSLHESESQRMLARASRDSDDEDEAEVAEKTLPLVERLRKHLPTFFPIRTEEEEAETTILYHDDISERNILVDEDGNLQAVIDWECVSALPFWKACDFPAFLKSRTRSEQPVPDSYAKEEDGSVNELYWIHLQEYELTTLRACFLEEMRQRQRQWVEVFESSEGERNFELAVTECNSILAFKDVNAWLDDMENGDGPVRGLQERFYS